MVDLTKDIYRTAQWKIWKAGAKGAEALRQEYTSKKALQRIALSNPFVTSAPGSEFSSRQRVLALRNVPLAQRHKVSQMIRHVTGHKPDENNSPSGVSTRAKIGDILRPFGGKF